MERPFSLLLLATALGHVFAADYSCPDVGSSTDLSTGATTVSIAKSSNLCTLTTVSALGDLVPIARSYDANDWEASAGPFATSAKFTCDDAACQVDLTEPMKAGRAISLTSFAHYTHQDKNVVARFLEQATYGPTKESVESFIADHGSSFENWVKAQMDPAQSGLSSHREFFRERLNPRMDQVYFSGKGGPAPCEVNSRWRKFAFIAKDAVKGKKFMAKELKSDDGTSFVLMIDGYARTVVSSIELNGDGVNLAVNTEYDLCHPKNDFWREGEGEVFKILVESKCYALKDGNPKVDIEELELNNPDGIKMNIIDMSGAKLEGIDNTEYNSLYWPSYSAGDEFILKEAFTGAACASLPSTFSPDGNPIEPIFAKVMVDSGMEYMLYDPRLVFVDNTVENPAPDGGGTAVLATDGVMKCANAPRTFLNEDHCFLSYDENACSPEAPPVNTVTLDSAFLDEIDTITGRHLYSFTNLPLRGDVEYCRRKNWRTGECYWWAYVYYIRSSACRWNGYSWSRFKQVDSSECDGYTSTITTETHEFFEKLLSPEFEDPYNPNPVYRDVLKRNTHNCAWNDRSTWDLGLINQNGTCWKHVHPQEGNIYDMTKWFERKADFDTTVEGGWVDISQWKVEGSEAVLKVPDELGNPWFFDVVHDNHRKHFKHIGKLDDVIPFRNLPRNLETAEVEKRFGEYETNTAGQGVVICGSVGEVANKPELGHHFELSERWSFNDKKDASTMMGRQKHTVWSLMALNASDQLRQRVAFALSQILVVAPRDVGDHTNTEASLQYYDIFVRNAFGSYRDVMKQVSFSEKMSRMLSSVRNKSYQYNAGRRRPAFPDENFAREIMQLFSIGLTRLNMDGSEVLDADGEAIENYGSDDLMSYSRVWTGLNWNSHRGNNDAISSRVDPMKLEGHWHDYFPKSDLSGGYLGERNYPLCMDLPDHHFLRKGATFRLLGSRSRPELVSDPHNWEWDPLIRRMELASSSPLYEKLCASDGNGCTYPGKVVLDADLVYDDAAKAGPEYGVESVRSVKVQSGEEAIYYEYVRQPCVEQTFYENAKKVEDYTRGRWNTNRMTAQSSMCADPRLDVASESCCKPDWESDRRPWNVWNHGYKYCAYNGERLSFDKATERCEANGKVACTSLAWHSTVGGICLMDVHRRDFYSWTQRSCTLKVKVSDISEVAVVHEVEPDYNGDDRTWAGVDEGTQNFFKPSWINPMPKGTNCTLVPGCDQNEEGCFCDTSLTEGAAFASASGLTKDVIRSTAFIGGPDPTSFDAGIWDQLDCGVSEVTVYTKAGSGTCDSLPSDAVFQFVDEFGQERFLKNLVSTVHIGTDSGYSFRNPVQFINFADPEVRDAYHEIDAAIDSYFYHPSHAPFLAHNLIQRFGISNPSPRFIETVATAYKNGVYNGIGSGEYGDLGALIAAILLDRESRSVALASDPTQGHIREPLLKIFAFMRAMEYEHDSPLALPFLDSLYGDIGQGSHEHPSVFSFFLPEFVPDGVVGSAGLVAPEAQVLNGKRVTEILEGLMKLIKNGLDNCDGGFAWYRPLRSWRDCSRVDGDLSKNYGYLTYSNDSEDIDEVIDEISMLLTAGRLSPTNRELVKIAAIDPFTYGERDRAIRAIEELVISTAEFQTTSIARNTEEIREPVKDEEPATKPYKAVVYLMFYGGMDSWNMIVPKCEELYTQYIDVRGTTNGLKKSELLSIKADINGASTQPCEDFGINSAFPFARDMYNAGDAMFFTNTGVLRAPVDKSNWHSTGTRLFAHNFQQRETMKLDVNSEFRETGVGGRILDYLKRNGHKTSANSVNSGAALVKGSPVYNNPVRLISSGWSRTFNRYPTYNHITERIKQLNGAADPTKNGLFGETWSARLMQSFNENAETIKLKRMKEYQVPRFYNWESGLDRKFRATAEYIKSREYRNVDTEVFVIGDGGYDMHSGNRLEDKFKWIDRSLKAFQKEMVNQGLWDNVVIMTGSDFGRTLVPNANFGTDHAWGGHYFMMGGGLNGGKVLGKYPEDITDGAPYRLGKRGRMIPTTSYNSIWNGVAQWLGVPESELDDILPNRENFPKCDLYTDKDLFASGSHDSYSCTA